MCQIVKLSNILKYPLRWTMYIISIFRRYKNMLKKKKIRNFHAIKLEIKKEIAVKKPNCFENIGVFGQCFTISKA